MTDKLTRFIFDQYNIRGVLVNLDQSLEDMLSRQTYPNNLSQILKNMQRVARMKLEKLNNYLVETIGLKNLQRRRHF